MNRFINKRVIVTGGCKGIGRAIVEKFLEEGAIVGTTYNTSKEPAEQLCLDMEVYSPNLIVKKMDVRDNNQVDKVMHELQDELKGIDILVNNAGIVKDKIFYSMLEQEWDDVIKTNLYGPFYTCKSILYNLVKQRSGCIINMSSVSGLVGIAGQTNYCASKFGLIGLTKALAKELLTKNIRVNAIAPGYVETDMIADVAANKKNLPGKVATPADIANIVLFLASEEAGFITGEVIVADGGIL